MKLGLEPSVQATLRQQAADQVSCSGVAASKRGYKTKGTPT